MAVYVDNLEDWGWILRGKKIKSCHMFTDSADLTELHEMAAKIGMRREWFQVSATAPHYDLTPSRRKSATMAGAIPVNRREAIKIWRQRRELVDACAKEARQ